MKLKSSLLFPAFFIAIINSSAQDYETCSFSEDAWAGDTAAINAFLISCGRIDTTNYDENGKKTTGKPHHQSITMKLNNGKVIHKDSIYFIAEKMPQYPGGDFELMGDISHQVRYPAAARTNHTEGNVVVSFIINREGKLTNPRIVRGIGNGCEEEALRVISQLKTWSPGKVKGKPVRVQMSVPVRFKLAG
jgi:TonB family protein